MRPATFVYRACGLSLASDAPIRGLRPIAADRRADVTISMCGHARSVDRSWESGSVWYESPELDASGRPEMTIEVCESGFRLAYCDDTTFLVDRPGDRVSVHWPAPLSDADAASYLTGSVLAFVLRLRGSVPLHASAVAIDGRALLFVGDSWSGKSSTAAAFSTLGYPVLADDIVRIDLGDGHLAAYPSHPRLNVWPDCAATLYGARDALPVHSDTYRKHYLDLLDAGYPFQDTPVPVDTIYVLKERSANRLSPGIRLMPPQAALMALVGQTYGNCLLDRPMRAREFDVLCRLVERVPVRELRFGDDLGALVSSCRTLSEGMADPNDGPT